MRKGIKREKPMRLSIALAALALAFGTTAALARSDAVHMRKHLMGEDNGYSRDMVEMIRGRRPYNAKVVEAAFTQWADSAKELPTLFPSDSKTGDHTRASPKIWEHKSDFDAKAVALSTAVADNRAKAVASLNGLKAAIPAVARACDNCHHDYRLSQR
jgi:cytochrome c556